MPSPDDEIAAGLDLIAAVIGSEGMLAVVFEVTVKLLPKAETARCLMASCADVGQAGDPVAAVTAAGALPPRPSANATHVTRRAPGSRSE